MDFSKISKHFSKQNFKPHKSDKITIKYVAGRVVFGDNEKSLFLFEVALECPKMIKIELWSVQGPRMVPWMFAGWRVSGAQWTPGGLARAFKD